MGDTRGSSSLFRRAEQLKRWEESETNKTDIVKNRTRKVTFSDGCIFLAAGAAGDRGELLRLLQKGADINTVNQDGITALHAACIDNNMEIVEFLVDHGADINRCDMEGWTPLHATASCGSCTMAKFLIDRGADLSLVNNDGELPIDVVDDDNDMARLLQLEMDVRNIDCDASRSREERQMLNDVKLWLKSGIFADVPHPKTGASALHVASAKGYIKVLRLLIEAGADVNLIDIDGWSPLHAAAHWGQSEAVEVLCDNLANMEAVNYVGQTPYDLSDDSRKTLMDELKKRQEKLKVINRPGKRRTSPQSERPVKKEKDAQSDVSEKSQPTPPQNRIDKTVDDKEIQSWRRASSLRNKVQHEDKNQKEESNRSSRINNNKENEEVPLRRGGSLGSKDDRNCETAVHRVSEPIISLNPSSTTRAISSNLATAHSPNGTIIPPPPKTAPTLIISSRTNDNIQSNDQTSPVSPPSVVSTVGPLSSTPIFSITPSLVSDTTTQVTPSGNGRLSTVVTDDATEVEEVVDEDRNSSSARLSAGSVIKNFFKSFVPPSRDDESETQRKAHAKMVRSTRRSTQGVTLEDIKSAEQLMKNKPPPPPSTVPNINQDTFSLEDARLKDIQNREENQNDSETPTVTFQIRKKNTVEEKKDDEQDGEKKSQTREGTQAAIQRKKKPKRRSTGVVHVDIDEIDPEKKALRDAERKHENEENDDHKCLNDKEGTKGSTLSVNSSGRSNSRTSVNSENGDIDYKKLYEEQLAENQKLLERISVCEKEMKNSRETIENNAKTTIIRQAQSESEKREKRALERKLSEMEEELRQLQKLKTENEKLKAENRALTRVVSKLTNSAAAGLTSLAGLGK